MNKWIIAAACAAGLATAGTGSGFDAPLSDPVVGKAWNGREVTIGRLTRRSWPFNITVAQAEPVHRAAFRLWLRKDLRIRNATSYGSAVIVRRPNLMVAVLTIKNPTSVVPYRAVMRAKRFTSLKPRRRNVHGRFVLRIVK